ncbi:MAG: pilus assembly FimT family protein [Burkholderiales bacterium]
MRDRSRAVTDLHIMTFCNRRHEGGFTILEQAVALSVIALLLGSILVPLQTQIENRKIDESRRMVELAQEMLMGFAAANGYFPCPADGASNGQEALGTNHVTGNCPVSHGYLPAASLGFKPTDAQGYALDAWEASSNRIRYAVSNRTIGGVTNAFTRVNGLRSIPMSSFGNATLFHICQSGYGVTASDCGTAVTLASNAVVVVWSVGPNGATGGTSAHEAQNPNPRGGSVDGVFVTRTQSNVPGSEFDDIVTWLPATALLSRLVLAGQFTPASQNAVSPPIPVVATAPSSIDDKAH